MKWQSIGIITGSCVLLFLTVCSFYKGPVQNRHGINTIVVDPGHGGRDPGASGAYSQEKDLTLQIGMKLGRTLQATLGPKVRVLMTRTTDIYQPVRDKAQIANDAKGDLFLCIHCNLRVFIRHRIVGYRKVAYHKNGKKLYRKVPIYHSYEVDDPDIKGTETYIFTARKEDSKINSVLANSDFSEGQDSTREGESEDSTDTGETLQNTPEDMIKAMEWSKYFFDKSYRLATMVEDEFATQGRSRGVMQRYTGIAVLERTNMPSILVETGYLSNREEEDYLNSDKGQQEIADAITRAVVRYKAEVEGKTVQQVLDSSKSIGY